MLARWRAAGLVVPTLMTLALLPLLIGLGTWQWRRLEWKQDMIARIEARRTAEPVSYAEALERSRTPGEIEYLRVRVSGAFDHVQERHVYAPRSIGSGWHVYTLFRPQAGAPPLFINRGWVSDAVKDPATRSDGQLAGDVTIVGLARASEVKGLFTPDNDVAGNRWYSRDLDGMRVPLAGESSQFAPFAIDAEAEPANPGGWPKGGVTEIRISNPHLQYIVTWYATALTLLGVFIAFARQRLAALDEPPQNL